jgi:hypothetical protein
MVLYGWCCHIRSDNVKPMEGVPRIALSGLMWIVVVMMLCCMNPFWQRSPQRCQMFIPLQLPSLRSAPTRSSSASSHRHSDSVFFPSLTPLPPHPYHDDARHGGGGDGDDDGSALCFHHLRPPISQPHHPRHHPPTPTMTRSPLPSCSPPPPVACGKYSRLKAHKQHTYQHIDTALHFKSSRHAHRNPRGKKNRQYNRSKETHLYYSSSLTPHYRPHPPPSG